MLMDHLTDGEVEGFLSGCLPPEDLRRVVRHLASGCQECGTRIHVAVPPEMFLPLGPPPQEDAYDACIDRALKEARRRTRRWKKDQERLERGLGWVRERNATFSGLTGSQMQTLVPWVRVEILLQTSFDLRYSDPWRMLDLAESAQKIADGIEETPYGPAFLADLRARAWSELANAARVTAQHRRAAAGRGGPLPGGLSPPPGGRGHGPSWRTPPGSTSSTAGPKERFEKRGSLWNKDLGTRSSKPMSMRSKPHFERISGGSGNRAPYSMRSMGRI